MSESNKELERAWISQRIAYYFKQAQNLLIGKGERDNYTGELAKLLRTL